MMVTEQVEMLHGAQWKMHLPLDSRWLSLKFIFLPDGEDPDTMVQQGKEAFEQL